MKCKYSREISKKYASSKRNVLLKKIIIFFEIPIAIIIVLIGNLCNLFMKPFKMLKASKMQRVRKKPKIGEVLEIEKVQKRRKPIRVPILLKKRLAFAYVIILIFFITCGSMYALLTDKALAETNLQVGSLLVKLEENAPFNNLSNVPEEGVLTNKKTFRAVSICNVDMYVRARIIPVIEKYDEKESCYVVIPIDINDVKLNVYAKDWTYSSNEGYYYYNHILKTEGISEDINVTVLSIENSDGFRNTNIRLTLRVELEATQAYNGVWKQIFNIDTLPFEI